jgi:hypothetical protein
MKKYSVSNSKCSRINECQDQVSPKYPPCLPNHTPPPPLLSVLTLLPNPNTKQQKPHPEERKNKKSSSNATGAPNPPFPNQKTTENRKRQQLLKLNGKNSNKHTT